MAKYMSEIMIAIFILLGVSMFLVCKYCKKKILKIGLASVIILITLYCIVLSIDMSRINSLKEPIFVVEYSKQEYANFSKTIYEGLGYRVEVETKENNQIISATMYMFEKVIAASIANSKEDDKDKVSISISEDIIQKLSTTRKIIIKNYTDENKDNILGTISDINVIEEIVEIMSSGKQLGDAFDCDRNGFDFEMYDVNDKLIDTVFVWALPHERIMPESIQSGCSYYNVSSLNNSSLTSIIEKETGFKFYNIFDYSEDCDQVEELIYEDDNYKYYFSCVKSDKMFIEFLTTGLKITIKEALNDNYITIDELLDRYPDLLIKRVK